MSTPADPGLEDLLEYVKDHRGFDFTGYKRSSLERRITKRMDMVHVPDYRQYRVYLHEQPDEFDELFNTILINVTSFFRDPETWTAVASQVIPAILETKDPSESVRVWVPGCATGEEAFTIAILLCEAMGEDDYRDRVKIYATDVDDDALTAGRHAVYSRATLDKAIDADLIERYFDPDGTHATFRKTLRRTVIFGRHDLVQDPPISKVDLLSCRNTLMYLTAPTQRRILSAFHFSLRANGFLLLGRSEVLALRTSLFLANDLTHRLFVPRDAPPTNRTPMPTGDPRKTEVAGPGDLDVKASGFELGQSGQLLVDTSGLLVGANQQARVLFGLTQKDVGRPLHDLDVSFRPLELRSRIEEAQNERRQVIVRSVEMPHGADVRSFDVIFNPMAHSSGALLGTSISFIEVTPQRRLQQELDQTRVELEAAYEELQSTVEELETTNEELQSTNEELETTNEELQSTNEELETMNEELQSTNEELETINDELRQRTEELNEVNVYLEAILTSLQSAVIVVDRDMRIQVWNQLAYELWGLRLDEVEGDHLMNVDIGLALDQLHGPLRNALAGDEVRDLAMNAVNRRGRPVTCRVRMNALRASDTTVIGVIILIDATAGEMAAGD